MKSTNVCVYTTMIGRYEKLNEQRVAVESEVPFICLTDDDDLRSETWQIRRVAPIFGADPIRSQRDLKIRPHLHLREFDHSLYIDNSVLLTTPPEQLFERHFPASGFCLPVHSNRESVLDEFLAVARLGFDDQSRIFEQLNHYAVDRPEVLEERPYWTAILLRDHRDSAVRAMQETWAAHVFRYSRRDQLSVNLAFRSAGLTPETLQINNSSSWFHSWPHSEMRDRDAGMRNPATALRPAIARVRAMEQALAEEERRGQAALAEQARRHEQLLAEQEQRSQAALAEQARHYEQVVAETEQRLSALLDSPRSF